MRSLILSSTIIVLSRLFGAPLPPEPRSLLASSSAQIQLSISRKRAPHPPVFLSPTSNESIATGSQLYINFLDGQLDPSVDSARFILKPFENNTESNESPLVTPNTSEDGTHKFDGVAIQVNVTVSKALTPGAYLLIAQEFYPQSSPQFQDTASLVVRITAEPPPESLDVEAGDVETQQLGLNSFAIRSESPPSVFPLRKRASPVFRSPTKNQKIITGHHLNISLVNVQETGKVRFVLKPIKTNPKQNQLVLFGRYAEANEIFHYENSTVNARVFFPEGIANGTYNLVAQDYSSANPKDLASIPIQVQQIRPITRLAKKQVTPTPISAQPSENAEDPVSSLFSEIQNQPSSLFLSQPCHPLSMEIGNLQEKIRRESPTMTKPSPGQLVPIGSKFLCEVQDRFATSETVHFHLRSFSGEDHYLGMAKYVRGVAKLQATCPTNVQFDSYSVMARQNSIKKPATFLDVIATSVVISHPSTWTHDSLLLLNKRISKLSPPHFVHPTLNQSIPAGITFDCELQNVLASDSVRFMLRANDSDSDLSVGSGVVKGNTARTKCQIPASVVPRSYELIAQKSSESSPDKFSDFDSVTITLADPSSSDPDISLENPKDLVQRSLQSTQSQKLMSAGNAAQVSILLEPTSYQTIVPGQGFEVKLKNDTSPLSSKLRFLLEPMVNSSVNQRYVLGTSSNGEAVSATLRCPDHIQNGTYLFIIQANDPNYPDKFIDSSSTPLVVKHQDLNQSDSSPK